jgi:predicted ribosome quality control (RQC) complex YloA/Tae2 family protein
MTKHNREKQAEVLRRTQAGRKEQKKQQVLKAMEEIINQKQPLTFANIATVAGCSIAYLYKWEEITDYIHELQQQKKTQLNPLQEGDPKPHSLKTLHEVARNRIRQLEAEIKDHKDQNEKLRGHVSEIYELRDECERLRHQLRELTNANSSSSNKVVPLRIVAKEKNLVDESPSEQEPEKKSDLE